MIKNSSIFWCLIFDKLYMFFLSYLFIKDKHQETKEFFLSMMLPFSCSESSFKGILSWSVSLWNDMYFAFSAVYSLFARNKPLIWLSSWFVVSKTALCYCSNKISFHISQQKQDQNFSRIVVVAYENKKKQ